VNGLMQQLAQFKMEIGENQRLRWGLFLIAAISGLYITLVLDDFQMELRAEYDNLVRQQGEIATLEPEKVWYDRAIREETELNKKEGAVWRAESEALARVNMQSKISNFAQQANLQKFNLKVGSFQPHAKLAGISVIRFELDAAYTDDNMLDFVNALESNMPLFNVARLVLRQGTQRSRVTMVIYAFYKA